MVLSHHHITVPVQLQRHRNVLLHMNFLHSLIMNIIPCHDGHLLNAFHRTRRSIRQVKYLVYHPARLIVLVILKKLTLFSLHKQRHSSLPETLVTTQRISKILLKYDTLCLLKEMVDSKFFNRYFSLENNSRKNGHAEFTKNPVFCLFKIYQKYGEESTRYYRTVGLPPC